MTVSSQTSNETFNGNGVTTLWDLPFRFFHDDEIFVYLVDPAAFTTTPMILGTDYTLTGAGLPEQFGAAPGKIATTIPVANLKQLYVERIMPIEQLTDIVNQGRFFPEVHEDVFDRLTMLMQQSDANSRGAIRVAIGDPEPSRLPSAALRANLLMGFDGLGNPTTVAPSGGSSTDLALMLANASLVTQGGAMIGRGFQVVKSIAELKTLLVNTPSKHAFVTGYYTQGDGGGGAYHLDSADVVSADNGGSIIVAADGGRWKLDSSTVRSVKQFGAKGDGVTNDQPAFIKAIAAAQAIGGGSIYMPAATFKLDNMLSMSPLGTGEGYHNVELYGEGMGATFLDFAGAPAGVAGIALFNYGGRFTLRDFRVKNAPGIGIDINRGEVRGGPSFISEFTIDRVKVTGSGSHGMQCLQTYLGTMRDIECSFNGGTGFNMQGFHTSMIMTRCAASNNTLDGWFINGAVYSSLVCCTSDNNGGAGYSIHNSPGLLFSACGAESNGFDGFQFVTGTLYISGIPTATQNIKGCILDGCYTFNNSRASAGAYANFLSIATSGARPATVTTRNCIDTNSVGGLLSVFTGGASGAITWTDNGSTLAGTVLRTGTAFWQNDGLAGRTILVRNSGNVSIPNNVDTVVVWDTVEGNRLNATYGSGAVTIPAGVNRIRMHAGVYWGVTATGSRTMRITKNGATAVGMPQQKIPGLGNGGQFISTAIVECNPGDLIRLNVFQDSGGALDVVTSGSSYLSVEVIG